MARPKRSPASDSRESPHFWQTMIDGSSKRRSRQNAEFERYARWHRGDLTDVVDPDTIRDHGLRWQASLDNMTYLATEAAKADLFFRWPRFVVRPPYPSQHPLFSPQLAGCETTYLTHQIRAVRYRRKARRCLQDALLGGIGILKVTMDSEVVIDAESLEAAQKEAQDEVLGFLKTGTGMDAREDQLHSVHIEVKGRYLTQAERGLVPLPKGAIKYLRKHIAVHEAMKGSERPSEVIQNSQIRVRRVNPLDYFYDPTVDDRDDASWRACRYLMRKADIIANRDFDREARESVNTTTDRWRTRNYLPRNMRTPGTYDIPEEMTMVYESFDFVDQKRRLFAEGGDRLLLEEDRLDLATIQPSGPFHELVFIEDTFEGQGVPPPASFEGEQAAATNIAAANVACAIQAQGKTLYDRQAIDAKDAEEAWNAPAASLIGVQNKRPEQPLKNAFHEAPIPKIEAQNMAILADLRSGIDKRSGLGTAKMGGGEQASTATGAALGAEASSSISDDRAATVDEWSEGIARTIVRLTRRFVPKAAVVEVCGPEANRYWPERWGMGDVANDIGVQIIPGSSRRQNTAIDQKQLLDGISAFGADPLSQTPTGATLKIEMYRRYFEDGGVAGLDWDSVGKEYQALMMAQMGGGEEPEPEPEGGGGAPGPDDEGRSTDINDTAQGVANVGGGQVPTGASIGDRVRMERGQAVSNVRNRK